MQHLWVDALMWVLCVGSFGLGYVSALKGFSFLRFILIWGSGYAVGIACFHFFG